MRMIIRKIAFHLYELASWRDGRTFRALRRRLLEIALGQALPGLYVGPTVRFSGVDKLRIGRNVSMHYWSLFSADGGLTIGDNVSIAHRCSIMTTEHSFDDPTLLIKNQPVRSYPVVIGNDVWIGASVTILSGVTIVPAPSSLPVRWSPNPSLRDMSSSGAFPPG